VFNIFSSDTTKVKYKFSKSDKNSILKLKRRYIHLYNGYIIYYARYIKAVYEQFKHIVALILQF